MKGIEAQPDGSPSVWAHQRPTPAEQHDTKRPFPGTLPAEHSASISIPWLRCSGAPVIGISALTGKGAEKLLPAALTMYEWWNQRIPTARLNRWVEQVGSGSSASVECLQRNNTTSLAMLPALSPALPVHH